MEAERLTDTIEHSASDLISELQAVRDSVEELYILLDHIWRSREELHDILASLSEKNVECDDDTIACVHCDAGAASLAAAVREGWKDLQYDDGPGQEYLGICPDCVRKQTEQERLAATAREMGLTDGQIDQAKAEGVTSELGLRRVEKNTRADEVPETIACARCDADSPESLVAAIRQGWTELCRDVGPGWNYLGVCPESQAQENTARVPELPRSDDQKRLFA